MPFGGGGFGGWGQVGAGNFGQSAFSNGPGSVFQMQHPSTAGSFGSYGAAQPQAQSPVSANNQANFNQMQKQNLDQYNQANAVNTGRWNTGVNMLTGARDQYNNSALTGATRGLVGGLLNDPLSLNQGTQNAIMNRATGSIDAGANQQLRNTAGALAAGGQSDASSIAAAQNMIGRNSQAAQAGTQANLGVQAALQRTQDIRNAAQLGQQQNAQDFGVNSQTANSYLHNMLLQTPFKYGMMAQTGSGMSGGGFGGMGGGGFGGAPGMPGGGSFHGPNGGGFGGMGAINFAGGGGMTGGGMGSFGFGGGGANLGGTDNRWTPQQQVNNGNPQYLGGGNVDNI